MLDFLTPNPTTSALPGLGSSLPVLSITFAYLYFVLKCGPDFMRNRPAYNLRYVILSYNFLQIVFNFSLFAYTSYYMLQQRPYDLGCCASLPLDHPQKNRELYISYMYYISRMVDFLDTIFFVLRKSFKQISFLHVFHHVDVVVGCYFYLRFYGSGGQMVSLLLINILVHGFMYLYYFLTVLDSELRKSLWWKKYLTCLQIGQFMLVMSHQLFPLLFRPNCPIPKTLLISGALQAFIMLVLFVRFYLKAYTKQDKGTTGERAVKSE